MNKSMIYCALASATAISITACSSGSDVAGIGGSGVTPSAVVSSGTVSGFGSIFVNGVEFETSSSTISVDDNPGLESDLAIGMRVTVDGTVNTDGITGTATSVSFDDQLQGPVSLVSPIDADGLTRTVTILGITTVLLNNTTTNFDISGTVSGTFDFNNITINNHVEVSGFFDSNGVLNATRVELKQRDFVANNDIVELKGTIENLSGTSFTVNNVNIDASAAAIDDLPGGLADGAAVEVKGTCADSNCNPVNATRVEGQTGDFDDNDDVELEGIITRYVSDSDFDVNGFPVDASGAGVERIPSTFTLGIDKEVEVEGTVVNGVLIATKVKDEGGDIKIAATVTAVDSSTGSFELSPVSGEPSITVMIDSSTEIEDEIDGFNSAALLDNLNPGTDFIVVEGFFDEVAGRVIASEVKREAQDDVILQGRLEQITEDVSVTVLGVSFQIQDDPITSSLDETDFENALDVEITQLEFISAAPVGTLIKIKDKNDPDPVNGTADEIDIED